MMLYYISSSSSKVTIFPSDFEINVNKKVKVKVIYDEWWMMNDEWWMMTTDDWWLMIDADGDGDAVAEKMSRWTCILTDADDDADAEQMTRLT